MMKSSGWKSPLLVPCKRVSIGCVGRHCGQYWDRDLPERYSAFSSRLACLRYVGASSIQTFLDRRGFPVSVPSHIQRISRGRKRRRGRSPSARGSLVLDSRRNTENNVWNTSVYTRPRLRWLACSAPDNCRILVGPACLCAFKLAGMLSFPTLLCQTMDWSCSLVRGVAHVC